MGERLAHPPLVEAVCEFRFHDDTPWDWSIPGRLYDRIERGFPVREEIRAVPAPAGGGPNQAGPVTVTRLRFKTQDGSRIVQCGPRLLAMNQLANYTAWEDFRAFVVEMFQTHWKLLDDPRLARVGLRYINRIDFSQTEAPSDKVTVFPSFPAVLDRPVRSFIQRYELGFDEEPRGTLVHQSGTVLDSEGRLALMLDLEHVSEHVEHLADRQELEAWLNAVHDRIYEAFVASLPRELFEHFKGGT